MPLSLILKNIKIGKSILIVAHGNSLRALYKIVKIAKETLSSLTFQQEFQWFLSLIKIII